MKGFIRRRGDARELRVFLGTDPVIGKKRYTSRTVRCGKREAQRVLNEMVAEAEQGLSARSSATVGELLERWFDSSQPVISHRRQSKGLSWLKIGALLGTSAQAAHQRYGTIAEAS